MASFSSCCTRLERIVCIFVVNEAIEILFTSVNLLLRRLKYFFEMFPRQLSRFYSLRSFLGNIFIKCLLFSPKEDTVVNNVE